MVCAVAAQGQEARCPSHKDKHPLVSGVVYDGPPEQLADLMPDVTRGKGDHAFASWEVGYVFDSGRSLYLMCRYAGLSDAQAVTVKVDTKVKQCVFRTHAGKLPAELGCK